MTPGVAAMASALSMISSGVTQTGQPGPWISSTSSGRSWSMPLRMMEWVWPPQTSMMAQGRVTVRRMSSKQTLGELGVAEFSRYFMRRLSRFPLRQSVARSAHGFAELFLDEADLAEQVERLHGGLFVEPRDGEADVDDGVVAHFDFGHVGQAGFLDDAAEVELAHADAVCFVDFDDFAGDSQTHG